MDFELHRQFCPAGCDTAVNTLWDQYQKMVNVLLLSLSRKKKTCAQSNKLSYRPFPSTHSSVSHTNCKVGSGHYIVAQVL